MPWTKTGDTAATYPPLLAVDGHPTAEDWSVNEVAGFVFRLFAHCAAHMRDYVVEFGEVKLIGNGRHEILVQQAISVGLMVFLDGEGRTRRWKLVEDPEFVHIRRRAEVLFDRQRDRDRRNPDLTMPVRFRDGDACRYCGQVVSWTDHKTGRAGTYDHRNPGQPATVDTYVVACRSCNSSRQDNPDADRQYPLLPAPAQPHYHPKTRQMLEAHYGPEALKHTSPVPGIARTTVQQRPGTQSDSENARVDGQRPGNQPEDAPHTQLRPEQDPESAPAPDSGQRPASPAENAPQPPRPGPDPTRNRDIRGGCRDGSGRAGSGLEGKGRSGSGRAPTQPPSVSSKSGKRKGRRSRRNPSPKRGSPREGT